MSELSEKRWAVISERGCEASQLLYADAARLVSQLKSEKVAGLCVITDAAAERLGRPPARNGTRPAAPAPGRRKSSRSLSRSRSRSKAENS